MSDLTAAVITVSDSVAAGTNPDVSGPVAAKLLSSLGFNVVSQSTVADGVDTVASEITAAAGIADLVVTTGGTGVSPRDLTPEATRTVIDREVPGLSEAMRSATFGTIPHGMLSRAVSGLRGHCLIINLPGSSKAVEEGLAVIGPALVHAVEVATGEFGDHR